MGVRLLPHGDSQVGGEVMDNFNRRFDDFDREFEKSARSARRWMIFVGFVILVVLAFSFWFGYHIVMHYWG